jgi:hypothetical protein
MVMVSSQKTQLTSRGQERGLPETSGTRRPISPILKGMRAVRLEVQAVGIGWQG